MNQLNSLQLAFGNNQREEDETYIYATSASALEKRCSDTIQHLRLSHAWPQWTDVMSLDYSPFNQIKILTLDQDTLYTITYSTQSQLPPNLEILGIAFYSSDQWEISDRDFLADESLANFLSSSDLSHSQLKQITVPLKPINIILEESTIPEQRVKWERDRKLLEDCEVFKMVNWC